MELKGVNNQQLCADLGFKYTTFLDWINEVTYPRIGKVEAMANYFGCEKSDLIEDRSAKDAEDDGLSESQRLLIQFAQLVPEDKADLALRVMKSILEDGK
jgi:hypothetical protein